MIKRLNGAAKLFLAVSLIIVIILGGTTYYTFRQRRLDKALAVSVRASSHKYSQIDFGDGTKITTHLQVSDLASLKAGHDANDGGKELESQRILSPQPKIE